MLPDQMPADLFQKQGGALNQAPELREPMVNNLVDQSKRIVTKPLKQQPLGQNHMPGKVFSNCQTSCYNSQKNLRNQTGVFTNNRYSSQNMKSFGYDEDQHFEEECEVGAELADENCAKVLHNKSSLTLKNQQQSNLPSQRYKVRVNTLRTQSQEECQRQTVGGGRYGSQQDDDELDLFERAHDQAVAANYLYTQERNPRATEAYSNAETDPQANRKGKYRYTTQPPDDENESQKENLTGLEYDLKNGAHFQYKDLMQKLSDITNSSNEKKKDMRPVSSRQSNRFHHTQTGEIREPLKEKTQEFVNQQVSHHVQGNVEQTKARAFSNSAKNSKKQQYIVQINTSQKVSNQDENKVHSKANQSQKISNNLGTQQKLTKLLLANQENNFIDRKMKDISSVESGKKAPNSQGCVSIGNNNSHSKKSLTNLHKSLENKQQCSQIGNMKIKTSSQNQSHSSQKNQLNGQINTLSNNNLTNGNSTMIVSLQKQAAPQQPKKINCHLSSSALANAVVTSSTTSSGNGNQPQTQLSTNFMTASKCPSSNFLRTATTAFTSSMKNSSAQLTQSNSNKQINQNRETPEATARQKVRLAGTALSSTSKRNAITTMSNGSQTNTIQSSQNLQLYNSGNHQDSVTKMSQGSDHKQQRAINVSQLGNQTASGSRSSLPRSNSSKKKVEVKKMMIKNQSFHKAATQQNQSVIGSNCQQKKQINDFYHTIFKKMQTANGVSIQQNQHHLGVSNKNVVQPRLSDSKKHPSQSKITSSGIDSSRLSAKISKRKSTGTEHEEAPSSVLSNSKKHQQELALLLNFQPTRESPSSCPRKSSSGKEKTERSGKITITNNMQEINQHQVNQIIKKLQEVPPSKISQGNSNQIPQSILLSHQMKKQQPYSQLNQRPMSGNVQNQNHLISDPQSSQQRINSLERVKDPIQNNYINQTEQSFDNRQSLAIQHKTIEKKSSHNPQVGKKDDKMNKYLQQKKEELMASVYNKTSAGNNKKGFLLANYKIQKNHGKMQQMTQEAYERMHLPTEEDDNCRGELMSEQFQINNFMTEVDGGDDMYAILHDKATASHKALPPQPATGNRLSVKIKAKNF